MKLEENGEILIVYFKSKAKVSERLLVLSYRMMTLVSNAALYTCNFLRECILSVLNTHEHT
jgi:hypothetical protein